MKLSSEERRAKELRNALTNIGKPNAPRTNIVFPTRSESISEADLMRLKREILEEVARKGDIEINDKITAAVVDKIRRDKMFDVSDLRNYQSFVYAKTKYGVHEMMHGAGTSSADTSSDSVLFTQTESVVVAETTDETTLLGSGVGSVTIPADYLTVGKTLRLTLAGIISTLNGSQNATFNLKLGGTQLATSNSFTVGTATNVSFQIHCFMTCYTEGATGTIWGQGMFYKSSAAGNGTRSIFNTSEETIDTTSDLDVDITIAWTTSDGSNRIQVTNVILEGLN